MALNAYHIKSHSEPNSLPSSSSNSPRPLGRAEPEYDYELNGIAKPTISRRPGVGISSNQLVPLSALHADDGWAWRTLKTGETIAAAAIRMRSRFIKATTLSDLTLLEKDAEDQEAEQQLEAQATAENHTAIGSMSELYASLAKDIERGSPSAQASTSKVQLTAQAPPSFQNRPWTIKTSHHCRAAQQGHRHDPLHRHKSHWFVTKALLKLQHRQAVLSHQANDAHEGKQSKGKEREVCEPQRCPTCGEWLPLDPSPAALALHRQSITHRLGLNAPVSSASVSEANTPGGSSPATPMAVSERNSRHLSPAASAATQAEPPVNGQTRRRSKSINHKRLGTSSRWKKLQSDNVGYGLLSRMGWKEGMGLGIEEWKWQQMMRERKRKVMHPSRPKRGNSTDSAIVLSSDDEADVQMRTATPVGAHQVGNGMKLLDWMANLPRAPAQDEYNFGDEMDPFHPPEPDSPAEPASPEWEERSSSALLTPIEVELKMDKRGLGRQRQRDRSSDGTIEIRRNASSSERTSRLRTETSPKRKDEGPVESQRRRMTKRRRELEEERKRNEWLALRASLF